MLPLSVFTAAQWAQRRKGTGQLPRLEPGYRGNVLSISANLGFQTQGEPMFLLPLAGGYSFSSKECGQNKAMGGELP